MRAHLRIVWTFATGAMVAGLLTGCSDRQPTSPEASGATMARGGGNGSSDPTVNSVDPDSATQDTTLDVSVFGSGFDKGSRVSFERGGQAAEKIRTNFTTFVTSKKVIANISIAAF